MKPVHVPVLIAQLRHTVARGAPECVEQAADLLEYLEVRAGSDESHPCLSCGTELWTHITGRGCDLCAPEDE